MSKKNIAKIIGVTTLLTGDSSVSTSVSVSKVEEKIEEEKEIKKQNKLKIRNKRDNSELTNNHFFQNCFVEKIYNYNDKTIANLSLILDKKKSLKLIKLFVHIYDLFNFYKTEQWNPELDSNWKKKFIIQTKKIITDIKNNSINLSAQNFDDNAIDAFAHQIWKNFPKFCSLFIDSGINQKIKIISNITSGYWYNFNFEIIGKKNKWEENEKQNQKIKEYFSLNYIKKIINNEENKDIEIKYQNDGSITYFFKINFINKIINFINTFKDNPITYFQTWFKQEINKYINFNNFFSNKIVPSDSELDKIFLQIVKNKNKYLYFSKYDEIIKINSKNNPDFFSLEKSDDYQNNVVEKIYDFDNQKWQLSIVLSREKSKKIIKKFIKNFQDNFIMETKKIITDIKNNSINLSAQNFDDNAIDAFAYQIWKNFPNFFNLFANLGINQQIQIRLDIKSDKWLNENFKIIGDKTEREKNKKQNQQEISIVTKKSFTNIENIENQKCIHNNNVVEKSTSKKMKIKINKIIFYKIIIIVFNLNNNKNNFIKNLIKLFEKFPPSYDDSYKLNKEELKFFAYLIWNNFSYYYNSFLNLKNDESIRIISNIDDPQGHWTEEEFNYNNEIVDKNNDVIDWTTFNDRKLENIQKEKKISHDQDFDLFNRKKRIDDSEPQPGPSKENLSKIIRRKFLGLLRNNNPDTILINLIERNPNLHDITQIRIESIDENSARILPLENSMYYTGEQRITFTLESQLDQNRETVLSRIISDNNLGNLPNNNPLTILMHLRELNPEININQIMLKDITANSARILPLENSMYYTGAQIIYFKADKIKKISFKSNFQLNNTEIKVPNIKINLTKEQEHQITPQTNPTLCGLHVLENILKNNIVGNKKVNLSIEQLITLFNMAGHRVTDRGITMRTLFEFINDNYFIRESLGFYYVYYNLDNYFWYSINEYDRISWVQFLIWESLSRHTAVPAGTAVLVKNKDSDVFERMGHAILIVGIQPNEDPFETIYTIRDSSPPFDENDEQILERNINGADLYNLLFLDEEPNFGSLILNYEVDSLFYMRVISEYIDNWNIENFFSTFSKNSTNDQ